MPNTKPVGVAYSDPQLDSVNVSGTSALGAVTASTVTATGAVASSSTVTGSALAATTAAGTQITFGNGQVFIALATAITANSTTTSAAAGSLGITSHATGVGKLFMSDGSKWQYAVVA
jgi:hypothetical protein